MTRCIEKKGIDARISFTGHSLGGALAQYMAIMRGRSAETFGALGILEALEVLRDKYDAGYPYPVINHVALGDAFGMYGHHSGKRSTHVGCDGFHDARLLCTSIQASVDGMRSYHGHTMDRYFGRFVATGAAASPRGQTYQNGKTYQKFKRFNGAGVAKDDYI